MHLATTTYVPYEFYGKVEGDRSVPEGAAITELYPCVRHLYLVVHAPGGSIVLDWGQLYSRDVFCRMIMRKSILPYAYGPYEPYVPYNQPYGRMIVPYGAQTGNCRNSRVQTKF